MCQRLGRAVHAQHGRQIKAQYQQRFALGPDVLTFEAPRLAIRRPAAMIGLLQSTMGLGHRSAFWLMVIAS